MNAKTTKLLRHIAKSHNLSLKRAKELWNETSRKDRGKLRIFLQA